MAESLFIPDTKDRAELYRVMLPQIRCVVQDEPDLLANMANTAAILREGFNFFWVGFYRVIGDELVLGPFQGPLACTRIQLGKGVCGTAFEQRETIVVPNVDEFPGHIACSSRSKSEIVVPGICDGAVQFVLDVDSDRLNDFSVVDVENLEQVVRFLCL